MEFTDEGFRRLSHRPSFNIVYLYSQANGTLDTHFVGPKPQVYQLQYLFTFPILDIVLSEQPKSNQVYDLDALKKRSFKFVYDPTWHIRDVQVQKLHLTPLRGQGRHLTFAGNTKRKRDDVYDFLEDTLAVDHVPAAPNQKLRLSDFHVTQAHLKVVFDSMYRKKSLPFTLTYPDSCTLGQEGDDARARGMLLMSGIEQRPVGVATR